MEMKLPETTQKIGKKKKTFVSKVADSSCKNWLHIYIYIYEHKKTYLTFQNQKLKGCEYEKLPSLSLSLFFPSCANHTIRNSLSLYVYI